MDRQTDGRTGQTDRQTDRQDTDLGQDLLGQNSLAALVELDSDLAKGGLAAPHTLPHHLAQSQGLVSQACPAPLQADLKQAAHEAAS